MPTRPHPQWSLLHTVETTPFRMTSPLTKFPPLAVVRGSPPSSRGTYESLPSEKGRWPKAGGDTTGGSDSIPSGGGGRSPQSAMPARPHPQWSLLHTVETTPFRMTSPLTKFPPLAVVRGSPPSSRGAYESLSLQGEPEKASPCIKGRWPEGPEGIPLAAETDPLWLPV